MRRRLISLFTLVAMIQFAIVSALVVAVQSASAANIADWQAGRIIDDSVFTDYSAMSAQDVQNFLNQKVGTNFYGTPGQCDTNGVKTSELGGGSRAQYGAAHGNPAPFTCLKDFYEVPKTDPSPGIPANNYGGGAVPAGAKSAAQIIWDAAQRYNINPKVLLVMIQKESAGPLITDDWPFASQYTYAMGARCPDGPNGAQCDSNYAGFSMQINESARLLRYYLNNMQQSWWTYAKPFQNNQIRWNTQYSTYIDSSGNTVQCGSGNVYIQNMATAALYTYTPYQPNQAALNNLYGSVPASSGFDSRCAAYGNRNFWRYYTDWFGTTSGAPYSAAYFGQSNYPVLNPGEQATVYLLYRNNGNQAWYDDQSISSAPAGTNPVHLATSRDLNRASLFSATWPGAARPALNFSAVYESDGTTLASNQHVAQTGQIVKYSFAISIPSGLGAKTYREFFQPIAEGTSSGMFNDTGTFLDVTVNPVPALSYISQSNYPTLAPTTNDSLSIKFKNTGNVNLYDDQSISSAPAGTHPVHLATSQPLNSLSDFSATWPGAARPALNFSAVYESDGTTLASNQHVAQPGQILKFSFSATVPAQYTAGSYNLNVQPILEGTGDGYFPNYGAFWKINVPSTAVFSVTNSPASVNLIANQPGQTSLTVQNVGNAVTDSSTQLTTSDGAAFQAPSWSSSTRVVTVPSGLAPGASTNLTIPLLSPSSNSAQGFTCGFANGTQTLITSGSCKINTSILAAVTTASYVGQSDWPTLAPNQSGTVYFKYKNTGNQPWYDDISVVSAPSRSAKPVHLATAEPINRTSVFESGWPSPNRPAAQFTAVYESDGTTLASNQHVAQAGQIIKFSFAVSAPNNLAAMTYREYFQPIIEGTGNGAINYIGTFQNITVPTASYSDEYAGQSDYPQMHAGEQKTVYFMYKNTGNQNWYDDQSISSAPAGTHPVHLATNKELNRLSRFAATWPGAARPALNFSAVYESDGTTLASNQHVARPGQIVKYSFAMSAPSNLAIGNYREYFKPILEGTSDGAMNEPYTFMLLTIN